MILSAKQIVRFDRGSRWQGCNRHNQTEETGEIHVLGALSGNEKLTISGDLSEFPVFTVFDGSLTPITSPKT